LDSERLSERLLRIQQIVIILLIVGQPNVLHSDVYYHVHYHQVVRQNNCHHFLEPSWTLDVCKMRSLASAICWLELATVNLSVFIPEWGTGLKEHTHILSQ
jgi:hypothetical protein